MFLLSTQLVFLTLLTFLLPALTFPSLPFTEEPCSTTLVSHIGVYIKKCTWDVWAVNWLENICTIFEGLKGNLWYGVSHCNFIIGVTLHTWLSSILRHTCNRWWHILIHTTSGYNLSYADLVYVHSGPYTLQIQLPQLSQVLRLGEDLDPPFPSISYDR